MIELCVDLVGLERKKVFNTCLVRVTEFDRT